MGCEKILFDGVVQLRAFRESDAEAMYRNWANDPEVTRYLSWEPHRDVGESRELVTRWAAEGLAIDTPTWAIVLEGPIEGVPFYPDEPIGSIGIVAWDAAHEAPEIGYCIGRPWWHHGVMSRALALVVEDCFEHRDAQRVEDIHDVDNPRSGLVMQHCGMVRASEECELRNGRAYLRYGITRARWEAVRGGLG